MLLKSIALLSVACLMTNAADAFPAKNETKKARNKVYIVVDGKGSIFSEVNGPVSISQLAVNNGVFVMKSSIGDMERKVNGTGFVVTTDENGKLFTRDITPEDQKKIDDFNKKMKDMAKKQSKWAKDFHKKMDKWQKNFHKEMSQWQKNFQKSMDSMMPKFPETFPFTDIKV